MNIFYSDKYEIIKINYLLYIILFIKDQKNDYISINIKINIRKNNGLNNILMLNDLHSGEVVKLQKINYLNKYNNKIIKKRIEKLFNENF